MNDHQAPTTGRTQRAAAGAAAGLLQYVLQMLFQALLAPMVLRFAGQEALGVYSIIGQSLGYLALVDLGLSLALGRELAQASGRDDRAAVFPGLLGSARAFGRVTNGAFALLVAGLAWCLPHLVQAAPESIRQGRIGLAVVAAWALVRTPVIVRATALTAVQDLAKANAAALFGNFSRLVFALALVWGGYGVAGLMVGQVVGEAITTGIQSWLFTRHHRPLSKWGRSAPERIRALLAFGSQALLLNLAVRLILQTDSIVVGSLFGAASAGVYYATQMPAIVLWNLPLRLSDNASPAIQELHAKGAEVALRRSYLRMHKLMAVAAFPIAVGIGVYTGPLVSCWVGPQQFAGTSMAWALAAFAVLTTSYVAQPFIVATGRLGGLSGLTAVEGVANLALSFWLGRRMGMAGVMWASVVAKVPTTAYILWRASRQLRVTAVQTLQRIWPAALAAVVAAALATQTLPLAEHCTWANLVEAVSLYGSAYLVLIWFVALAPEERERVLQLARGRFGVRSSYEP
ncbi:lipopolysaccharide biosynthesis protein [Anaeromyxobacter paludicola]|uniref:Polysaccharide biosynthesis protein n=1 Tax=Anaeromyxobacter paludicola TaxID=2918171 RepID=A0ABN6N8V0_9BACT|nr:oligosaccharide flippase family protein [Anaeromyxobacter paludicola]BDG09642.1 hypothetical protein AMPC_27550 [Anaeromyxobacter paludicola]